MPESLYPQIVAGPPKPSAIIQPRAFSLPPNTERYVVAGAGALLVTLEKGDTLTITNDEGGQLCEIIAADEKGRIDPGMLGGTATGDGGGLKALLMSGDASLTGLRLGIEARRIDLATAGAIVCFGGASPAGDTASFTADRDGVAIIAAPGGIMDLRRRTRPLP